LTAWIELLDTLARDAEELNSNLVGEAWAVLLDHSGLFYRELPSVGGKLTKLADLVEREFDSGDSQPKTPNP
jgi:hypothetical protein